MRKAGSLTKYPRQGANQIIKSLRNKLRQELEEAGLTANALAQEHARIALKAEDPRYGGPNDKIRLKAISEAYNIMDLYPPKKVDIDERREEKITVSLETIRLAERHSRVIDVEALEEDDTDDRDLYRPL